MLMEMNKIEISKQILYCDDCFNIFPIIPDKSIDAIIADMPFGTTNCKWDVVLPLNDYIKVGKHFLSRANDMPMKAHENILVFYKKLPLYNPIMTEGHVRKVSKAKNRAACIERRNNTDNIYNNEYSDRVNDYDSTQRYPRSVIKFKTDKQTSNLHKTQKPLALLEYLIKTYTNENDLILDNCMGSGTTNLASLKLNRRSIGIEKDEKIFNNAHNRLNNYISSNIVL
jgi:site-specific DNA-methyltransferase (adenine-specific)